MTNTTQATPFPPPDPVPAAPQANDHTLLDLHLLDPVAATVAVDAVVHTLRDLGLEAAVLDSLATVLLQILQEARDREVFAGDPPTVRVTLNRHGRQVLVRVSDLRMPQWGAGTAHCPADGLVRASRLDGFHRGEQGDTGNWSECVLSLPALAGDSPLDAQPSAASAPAAGAADAPVQLRELRAADAEGLVRLIYRVYGYSDAKPEFYLPETIRRWLKTGGFTGVVALDETGEVVGHVALTPDTPYLTADLGRLAVDPRWRGRNLASRLTDQAPAQAGQAGTPALWAECVANHPASQRLFLAAGGHEVGLLLGAFPAMRMSRCAEPRGERQTLTAITKTLAPSPPCRAQLPAHLEPIYRQLCERHRYARRPRAPTSGRSPRWERPPAAL